MADIPALVLTQDIGHEVRTPTWQSRFVLWTAHHHNPMPAYSATDLNKQVEFLELVTVPDGGGGFTREWDSQTPPLIVYAGVKPRSSRERFLAGQTASAEVVLFVVRYRSGLHQDMRIKYNNRVFDIIGMVDVDERHEWFEIDAEEKYGE